MGKIITTCPSMYSFFVGIRDGNPNPNKFLDSERLGQFKLRIRILLFLTLFVAFKQKYFHISFHGYFR